MRKFNQPLARYVALYEDAIAVANDKPGKVHPDDCFAQRVEATWGMIAHGANAIPYALEMLASPLADVREDAGGILGELGGDDAIADRLILSLRTETDAQARDSLILALGQLRNRRAIAVLSDLIRDPELDGDTQHMAIEALGRIVRRRFLKQPDNRAAAIEWLERHGYQAGR